MTVFSLIIINKAGGLIYNRTFQDDGLNKLSTNDYLVLAGTFHGVHAITARLNPLMSTQQHRAVVGAGASSSAVRVRPEPPCGLEVLDSDTFRLQCFNTMTGTKFLIFTEPGANYAIVEAYLRRIYDLYADYVMKNPFYALEMPIRCDMFDRKLASYVREINSRG